MRLLLLVSFAWLCPMSFPIPYSAHASETALDIAINGLRKSSRSKQVEERERAVEALGYVGPCAVPTLIEALSDESESVRKTATGALGRIGTPAAIPLIDLLCDDDRRAREAANLALGKIESPTGEVLAQKTSVFVKALQDDDEGIRMTAATSLGKIGVPKAKEAIPQLITTLRNDKSPFVRGVAASALSEFGPAARDATGALIDACRDEDRVRSGALHALAAIGEAAVPALVDALRDKDDASSHIMSILASVEKPVPAAVPFCLRAIEEGGEEARSSAVRALGWTAGWSPASVRRLVEVLQDDSSLGVREQAGIALRYAATADLPVPLKEQVVLNLIKLIGDLDAVHSDKSVSVRQSLEPFGKIAVFPLLAAIDAQKSNSRFPRDARILLTFEIKSEDVGTADPIARKAISSLIERFDHKDSYSVAEVASKVASRFGAVAVPQLVEALSDDRQVVREQAAYALGRIGPAAHEALPSLILAFREDIDGDQDAVHVAVARAIGAMGAPAEKAVPDLINAIHGKYIRVGETAAIALSQIGPPAATALAQSLKSDDPYVRRLAAKALGYLQISDKERHMTGKLVVQPLKAALGDSDDKVREEALEALGRVGPAAGEAVTELINCLQDSRRDSRRDYLAAKALGNAGPAAADAVPMLVELLDEIGDPSESAMKALASIGEPAVPALIALLKEGHESLQEKAMKILGKIGSPAAGAVPELVKRLDNEDWILRLSAVEALGSINANAAEDHLRKSLRDSGFENWTFLVGGWLFRSSIAVAVPITCRRCANYPCQARRQSGSLLD